MTPPPIERYVGREQAYIKHFFLASYLEPLVHKVGSRYGKIVYVDGFSGPWENEGSDYADTSFGIALQALRTARATWLKQGRDVKMTAVLVEKRKKSHDALLTLQPRYPDVEIKPFHADFRTIVDQILREIPRDAFAFVLLDPRGWRIPIATIEPLLRRPNTEVVFNFMFEFINRAASMSATDIVEGLDELLPTQGWRAALEEADLRYPERDRPALRRQILIDTFRKVLAERGNYGFVAETPVMRPLKNSMLYALVYATRAAKGIEVFRDCQLKTLREQEAVRGGDDLLLKIGIHEGPCIAVSLNQRQDYFGQTVNIASRVQHLATATEIFATSAVLSDSRTSELLAERGLRPSSHDASLRGITRQISILAIPSVHVG